MDTAGKQTMLETADFRRSDKLSTKSDKSHISIKEHSSLSAALHLGKDAEQLELYVYFLR